MFCCIHVNVSRNGDNLVHEKFDWFKTTARSAHWLNILRRVTKELLLLQTTYQYRWIWWLIDCDYMRFFGRWPSIQGVPNSNLILIYINFINFTGNPLKTEIINPGPYLTCTMELKHNYKLCLICSVNRKTQATFPLMDFVYNFWGVKPLCQILDTDSFG